MWQHSTCLPQPVSPRLLKQRPSTNRSKQPQRSHGSTTPSSFTLLRSWTRGWPRRPALRVCLFGEGDLGCHAW